MVEIRIDTDKCTGCGTCADVCPTEMLRVGDDGKATITGELEECVVCRACEASCPSGAIEVIE